MKSRRECDISQNEYERQVMWLDTFADELKDMRTLRQLPAEYEFDLIPKPGCRFVNLMLASKPVRPEEIIAKRKAK